MKVFISHSFDDPSKFADLTETLKRDSIPFFRPLDMTAGRKTLADQLREAIAECDVCIFIATHNSVASPWCGAELGAFWGANKPVIIYIMDSDLSETLLPKQFQGHLFERGMYRVVEAVKNLAAKERIVPLAEAMPSVSQFHGYSGKWQVKSIFSRWRGRDVRPSEEVVFNGDTLMFLPANGRGGWGEQTGVLRVALGPDYRQTRFIHNGIRSASLDEKGQLDVELKVLHRVLTKPIEGTPPTDLGEDWLQNLDEAPPFHVVLFPVVGKQRYLQGYHKYEPGRGSHQVANEDWTYVD